MTSTNAQMVSAARNLAALFVDRVEATPDKEAFRYLDHGEWVSVTWRDTATRVESLAAGLLALGIEPEQRVGIASSTRYEWILADLAIMSAGAATTTVYANTITRDTGYILADSESRVVFAEDADQLAKLTACRGELPALTKVVVFDGSADGDWVITLEDLAELGAKFLADHPSCVRDTVAGIAPDRLATLIYTSGTTGRPKGVRLSHKAWVYEGATVDGWDIVHADDVQLLWLPLAHAFGKVVLAAQMGAGFVNAVDGRVDKSVDNCAVVKPTFMCAAPRIFEKAYARVVTTQRQQGGIKAKLFDRA
ncbi:MAG: AMP-binding protein, partial [Mycobacterium sp.]|nr:AMP-binding protein [Mycobacterium sp.]